MHFRYSDIGCIFECFSAIFFQKSDCFQQRDCFHTKTASNLEALFIQRRDFRKYDCRNAKSTHSQGPTKLLPYHFYFTLPFLFYRVMSILPQDFYFTVPFLLYRILSILPYHFYFTLPFVP